jgi:hypothetical protein
MQAALEEAGVEFTNGKRLEVELTKSRPRLSENRGLGSREIAFYC